MHMRIPTFLKSNLPAQKQNRLFRFNFLNEEMYRRKTAEDGHEIIDKATYNRIMKPFFKAGGIVQQDEDAIRHLNKVGASALYINGANTMLLTKTPRVSEVLEEAFHARQDRANRFGTMDMNGVVHTMREIEAQQYLLSVTDKYKIPKEETEVTLRNLIDYQQHLQTLLRKENL